MLKELLREYDLPKFPEGNVREECLKLMQKYEFGHMPKPPKTLHWEVVDASDKHFAGGKTLPTTVRLYGELENGREYGFPVRVCIPVEADGKTGARVPFFIHLNFRPDIPDKYQPTEEIIDNGFAVLSFCYTEVTSDDGDFTNGLAGALFPDGKREGAEATGKLAMWAWAAMRVMDHLRTVPGIDRRRIVAAGHSRLARAALLAAGLDPRFSAVLANEPGCMGGALATACADRCIVVTTTDPPALRDAQHTVMELDRFPRGRLHLVVNRVRGKLLRSMHATIDDAIDTAGLPLLGVVPEDDALPLAQSRGAALLTQSSTGAAAAYRNIARRITGERVPLLRLR